MQPRTLKDRFYAGDRPALSRVLSYVEDYPNLSNTWIAKLPHSRSARVAGITGPPGAGKSTLIGSLIKSFRSDGRSVAVLAFDPSSRESGGAALGDRIRMLETWDDDGVYVRSLASRGRLGGLSNAVFGALRVLDAFGFDEILVETVGVGQGEIDIAVVADITVLVQVPGAGDVVQLLKAGVLEVADILVVNKADLPGAERLVRELRSHVRQLGIEHRNIPVVAASASEKSGILELRNAIDGVYAARESTDGSKRMHAEIDHYLHATIDSLVCQIWNDATGREIFEAARSGQTDPWETRNRLLALLATNYLRNTD